MTQCRLGEEGENFVLWKFLTNEIVQYFCTKVGYKSDEIVENLILKIFLSEEFLSEKKFFYGIKEELVLEANRDIVQKISDMQENI